MKQYQIKNSKLNQNLSHPSTINNSITGRSIIYRAKSTMYTSDPWNIPFINSDLNESKKGCLQALYLLCDLINFSRKANFTPVTVYTTYLVVYTLENFIIETHV